MFFVPIKQWMSDTSSWRHSRSEPLKKLDAAIAAANQVDTDDETVILFYRGALNVTSEAVKSASKLEEAKRKAAVASVNRAFSAWAADQTKKGQDWRTSVRNSSGAITVLFDQLVHWRRIYPGEDTGVALAMVIEQQNNTSRAVRRLRMHCPFGYGKSSQR